MSGDTSIDLSAVAAGELASHLRAYAPIDVDGVLYDWLNSHPRTVACVATDPTDTRHWDELTEYRLHG